MGTFEQDTDLEYLVNAAFIHSDANISKPFTVHPLKVRETPILPKLQNSEELAAFFCVLPYVNN